VTTPWVVGCRRGDLNPHGTRSRQILSLMRMPISPLRLRGQLLERNTGQTDESIEGACLGGARYDLGFSKLNIQLTSFIIPPFSYASDLILELEPVSLRVAHRITDPMSHGIRDPTVVPPNRCAPA
jgi:hypothetical protein